MAKNIVEAVQQKLGYAPLQKIDPNTQDSQLHEHSAAQRLAQAAIPAVLTALYKFTRTDDGCHAIISGNEKDKWLSLIYGGKEHEAAEKVAAYSGINYNESIHQMENIADESVRILQEVAGNDTSCEKIKNYMNFQRHHILVHLPAALDLGHLLNDEALDDRTNKMEGPVSNFMHKIEDTFSGGGRK